MPRHHLMACEVVTSKLAGIAVSSMRLRFATLDAASPEEDAADLLLDRLDDGDRGRTT